MDDPMSTVRSVVAEHGRLTTDVTELADTDSLYVAGLTSHASVNVLLALEDAFDLEFPEELLKRSTFESLANLVAAIGMIEASAGAA